MTITNLKYASEDKKSIRVTTDTTVYVVTWPCFTWHRTEIEKAISGGMNIDDFKTIAEIKDDKYNLIKAERDRRTVNGGYKVTLNDEDKWFHSDQFSRGQQLGLAQLGTNVPAGLQWKTMDGSFVTMTPELAQQILIAGSLSDTALFQAAEAHKAALYASSTPATYNHLTGWPLIFGE